MMLLFNLVEYEVLRIKELKEKVSGIANCILSLQLKKLEADQLIQRQVFLKIPPRVEYTLTCLAHDLLPI